MLIYLADLGHNLLTRSSDVYPLGIANLAAWLMRVRPGRDRVRLFREPQDLKRALDEASPDVMGFSNYAWNFRLSAQFAAYAKARNPATVTVIGGPNWPLVESEKERFLGLHRQFDVAVEGPTYEGEQAFGFLIDALEERGFLGLAEEPVAGTVLIDPRDGSYRHGGVPPRFRDLDDIPSPYLAGLLDPFFDTDYFPLMQIARGCPFTCSFCNSGETSNNRIAAHSVANVKDDLLYIADRVRPEIILCLADDNFGMYQRDEEIADFIAWLRKERGWPNYIRTTTGKNNTDRILRVLRTLNGMLPMTAAVQSMNPVVLSNIKRSNIKLDTYRAIQKELDEQGLQSYGELILCLPGETRETFLAAVAELMNAGAKRISAHQLMLLHGAELENPETRERFGFDTRFRVVARNIGDYLGEPVIEVEEMVVATPTFSFADYLDCRVFHLLLTIYYYEGNFDEAFRLAESRNIKAFDLMRRLQERLTSAPEDLRDLITRFLEESQAELFMTDDACLAWARQNYDKLVAGDVGGNLLSKYSLEARFWHNEALLDYLEATLRELSGSTGLEDRSIDCVFSFLDCSMITAPFEPSLKRVAVWTTSFDLRAWMASPAVSQLSKFELTAPQQLELVTTEETARTIRAKVKAFGENPQGLGKITRTMFARDMRRRIRPSPILEPIV